MTDKEEKAGLVEIVEAALLLKANWGTDKQRESDSKRRLIQAMIEMDLIEQKDFSHEDDSQLPKE